MIRVTPHRSLQHAEALERFALLQVTSNDVTLDLAADEETFSSRTRVIFESRGGPTFVDLKPRQLREVRLNGDVLDPGLLDGGRFPLNTTAGTNELVVDAVMAFRRDGEGLHHFVDPADGRRYVYGMSFMDAAPSIFACFDQPDLKAPYTFHVRTPTDWKVFGNAPGEQVEPGQWELATTPPLSTYFVTLVAGPYHLLTDEHDGIPLGLSARQSLAADLDRDADELFGLTRVCFDEMHRLFGIRYPFGDYHQAFVPEFNAGAMENPGCVTYRDPMIFSSRVTRGERIKRATTVAHEMAHQWFGNITTPKWWDDLWLNESFAEYLGNRVTADVTEYSDTWVYNAYARRQWGLVADQRPSTHPVAGNGAVDATAALQDFDGISYAKGSSLLKMLNRRLGDEVFFGGVVDHLQTHRFGNATMHDLIGSWERAGAGDLSGFTDSWLRTPGPDTLEMAPGWVLRRTPPPAHPADRSHTFHVAVLDESGEQLFPVTLEADETPAEPTLSPGRGAAVLLDPYEETWGVTLLDADSVTALKQVLPRLDDELRAGVWNSVRSTFHQGRLSPADVLDLVEAGMPHEEYDAAVYYTAPWALSRGAGLSDDPAAGAARVHAVMRERTTSAEPGSTLQLAAFQSAVASAGDEDLLRTWLSGNLPEGLVLDLDLRWALLVRLAALGCADEAELDAALAAEPTGRSRVEHARARASVPSAEAKEWAWRRLTGEVEAANYELEAAGVGMWRTGQEKLTAPYADKFLDLLPTVQEVHTGWVLGTAVTSFFPLTHLDEDWARRAHDLVDRGVLDATVRRNVVDQLDELGRRIAVRRSFGNG